MIFANQTACLLIIQWTSILTSHLLTVFTLNTHLSMSKLILKCESASASSQL